MGRSSVAGNPMKSSTQHVLMIDRWIRRFAWASVANWLFVLILAIVMAAVYAWRLESWNAWETDIRLKVIFNVVRYVQTLLMSVFCVLMLFGLTRFIHYLLAYRQSLMVKKRLAPPRNTVPGD